MDSERQGLRGLRRAIIRLFFYAWQSANMESGLNAVDYKKINKFCAFTLGIYADTDRMSCEVDFEV